MTTETATATTSTTPTDAGAGAAIWHTYADTGAEEIRNELVVRYLPLVKYVAGRLRATMPGDHDTADLISEGILGLIDAIEKYDPDRGVQFQTYASIRVRGAIIDALRTHSWVPRTVLDRKRAVDAATAAIQHRLGRTPTTAEIADEAGLTLDELHRIRRRPSLSVGVTDDDLDTLETFTRHNTCDDTTRIALTDAISNLSTRDQTIIALYFYDGLTLAEIGEVLGVTEGRVSQLRTRALKALRAALDEN